METEQGQRARQVHRLVDQLGFGLVGIAPAETSTHADFFRRWLAQGKHGDMHYLAEHLNVRLEPNGFLENARSIICVADFHTIGDQKVGDADPTAIGRIARYAWGDDYHDIIKRRLFELADALRAKFPDEQFRVAVDTAPMLEREHAARAGLGWIGKHTLLIHPQLGSWMLLGVIVTTLRLQTSAEADYPQRAVPPTDHCGTCTRCIDACPTGCITPYSVDASRCISYLTIEHRGLIEESVHGLMSDWIAGCDVCQEVCPYNQESGGRDRGSGGRVASATLKMHPEYTPRDYARGLSLLDVLHWTAEDRRRVFTKSALKRIKLDMLKRNALIAAGNYLAEHDDAALRERITELSRDADEPELVRITAKQVLARLA